MVAFLPSVTTAVLHDRNLFGGSALAWLTAALVGALAAGAVLGLAHLSLGGRERVVVVLVVFLVAGAARGLGVGGTAWSLGLVDDPQWELRAASGAVLAVFWLSVATIIVDGFRRHRHTRMQLVTREADVRRQLAESATELTSLRSRAQSDITGELAQAITALTVLPTDDDAARQVLRSTATSLHDLSSSVVRPLSHVVATRVDRSTSQSHETAGGPSVLALRTIISDAATVDPFRPGWLIVLLFPSILMTAIRNYGFALGILGAAWIAALAGIILWCSRRWMTPRLPRWPVLLRTVLVVGVWLIAALASAVPVAWSSAWGVGPDNSWAVFGVPLLAYVPITCLGIAIATAISQAWALDEETRAARIAALDWQEARQQQQIWSERQRLGRHLHGTVQSTLTSVALGIEAGLRRGTPLDEIRDDATERLATLVNAERVPEPPEHTMRDVADVLGSIARVWSRLAEVTVTMTEQTHAALAEDGAAADKAVEITREGIANAIRHGHARRVEVVIDGVAPGVLGIEIRDDGSLPSSTTAGLGSATLDELCLEWSRDGSAAGTVLRCRVPAGASTPTSV